MTSKSTENPHINNQHKQLVYLSKAKETQLALQRQLMRERVHLQWLEQHLSQSTQLSLSK